MKHIDIDYIHTADGQPKRLSYNIHTYIVDQPVTVRTRQQQLLNLVGVCQRFFLKSLSTHTISKFLYIT